MMLTLHWRTIWSIQIKWPFGGVNMFERNDLFAFHEEIHESIIKVREQFIAWSEEVAMIKRENQQTAEFRRCVAEIKKDLQRYRELMRQLPNVEEFSDEEVEKMSGKASQLLDVAGEVTILHTHVRHQMRRCTSC